jgi:hypothetical protein
VGLKCRKVGIGWTGGVVCSMVVWGSGGAGEWRT